MRFLLVLFIFICSIGASVSKVTAPPRTAFWCQKCQQISSLVSENLVHVEKITRLLLTSILEIICQKPRKAPIAEAVCEVLENNFVEGVVKIIQGLEKQLSPSVVCHKVCQ